MPIALASGNTRSHHRGPGAICTIAYKLCAFYGILCVCQVPMLLIIRWMWRFEPDQVHQISHFFLMAYRRHLLAYKIIIYQHD
jgi:hypothetical protein